MDWPFLTFSLFFTGYSLYAWKKYYDNDYFWLAILYVFVVLLLISKLFLINLFPESVKSVIRIVVYCSWALMLVALFLILKKRK
jgi:hypothetical protein